MSTLSRNQTSNKNPRISEASETRKILFDFYKKVAHDSLTKRNELHTQDAGRADGKDIPSATLERMISRDLVTWRSKEFQQGEVENEVQLKTRVW